MLCAVTVGSEAVSTYLEKYSTAMMMCLWPLEAVGRMGPMMSTPQAEKGHGEARLCNSDGGMWI